MVDPARRLSDIVRQADVALACHTPPAVVIDNDAEILQFRGNTTPYLAPPPGAPTANLFKMARAGLQTDLRAAVDAARTGNTAVRRGPVIVSDGSHLRPVTLEVTPLTTRDGGGRHFVVLFAEEAREEAEGRPPAGTMEAAQRAGDDEIAALRRDLGDSRGSRGGDRNSRPERGHWHTRRRCPRMKKPEPNEEPRRPRRSQSGGEEPAPSTMSCRPERRTSRTNNDLTNVLTSVNMPVILVMTSGCGAPRWEQVLRVIERRRAPGQRPALNLAVLI